MFQGVTVDEERIKVINQLADRLISQGRTDKDAIKRQKASLNEKYVIYNSHNYITCVILKYIIKKNKHEFAWITGTICGFQ